MQKFHFAPTTRKEKNYGHAEQKQAHCPHIFIAVFQSPTDAYVLVYFLSQVTFVFLWFLGTGNVWL